MSSAMAIDLDLSDVVFDFAERIDVERPGKSYYDQTSGRHIEADPFNFTITGSLQRMNGAELNQLPEGLRTREAVMVYTIGEPLRTVDTSDTQKADILKHRGKSYEVFDSTDWGHAGKYGVVIAIRVTE